MSACAWGSTFSRWIFIETTTSRGRGPASGRAPHNASSGSIALSENGDAPSSSKCRQLCTSSMRVSSLRDFPSFSQGYRPEAFSFWYQTASREYMASSHRRRYEEGVRQWLASTPPRRAVWLEAEATSERQAAFAIVAHVPNGAGGIQSMELGYTNIHPETVRVRTKGATDFAKYFSSP
jgi:hypothetical protein